MSSSLRTAASGMIAQQRMIDVIANNLANVNTTAFKQSRASFEDVLYETLQGPRVVNFTGSETVGPVQIGKGVRLAAVLRFDGQGPLEITDRPLDVAIDGDGYFQIERPDGQIAYTRDGSFTLSESGALVTTSGYLLLPGILVPQDATGVSISSNGVVSVSTPGSSSQVEIGRFEMARFLNPAGLLAVGENQMVETEASGAPLLGVAQENGFGRIIQGSLESSNVELVQEMTDMISAQRAYEINAKVIRVIEDMARATQDLII